MLVGVTAICIQQPAGYVACEQHMVTSCGSSLLAKLCNAIFPGAQCYCLCCCTCCRVHFLACSHSRGRAIQL